MSAPSPSMPLGLLNPGEFFMNPANAARPGVGGNASFSGAMSAAMSGALNAAGYGTIASGLTATTGTINQVPNITTQFAAFGTVPSGAGAQLPSPASVFYPVRVANYGVSGLSVFPPNVSGIIDAGASGVAYIQATGTVVTYCFAGGNQYYHQ